jgi:hypothetical protein
MNVKSSLTKLNGRVELLIIVISFLILSLMVGGGTLVTYIAISQMHRDMLISVEASDRMRSIEVEELKNIIIDFERRYEPCNKQSNHCRE